VKVFISHSSDEEWLVRVIAPELEKLGIVAYHYERNEMGSLVEETIEKEISECDEFLVLLTPTSVKSEWVIEEITIATFLRKRVIAFYMYLDDAAIPRRLKNVLRRHVGEIQVYYDELRRRMMPEVVDEQTKVHEQEAESGAARPVEFAVGDVQQAIRNPFKAAELRDLIRGIVASSLVMPATPPEPKRLPKRPRRKKTRK
jgi:TIR domain